MIPPEMREPETLMAQLATLTSRFEYWLVQNSGWSAGVSWFNIEKRRGEPRRFASEDAARSYIGDKPAKNRDMKWRIVHVEVVREPNRRIKTETFIEVNP